MTRTKLKDAIKALRSPENPAFGGFKAGVIPSSYKKAMSATLKRSVQKRHTWLTKMFDPLREIGGIDLDSITGTRSRKNGTGIKIAITEPCSAKDARKTTAAIKDCITASKRKNVSVLLVWLEPKVRIISSEPHP